MLPIHRYTDTWWICYFENMSGLFINLLLTIHFTWILNRLNTIIFSFALNLIFLFFFQFYALCGNLDVIYFSREAV